ncbi:MAG: hypothetical protein V4550_18515 [Gemmatimonadota bacterium]
MRRKRGPASYEPITISMPHFSHRGFVPLVSVFGGSHQQDMLI